MLPVLGNERNILFLLLLSDLRRIWSACTIGTSVGPDSLTLQVLLVLDRALRIVKHLGQEVPFGFFDSLRLLEFVHGLLSILMRGCFLSTFLSLGCVQRIVDLPVDLLSLHVLELTVDISAQVIVLDALPLVTISLHSVEGQANLIRRELTVLTHRVDTNHILNLLGRKGLWLDLGPIARVPFINSIWVISDQLLYAVILGLFVFLLCLFLLHQFIFDSHRISHAVVVRLNEKARVIFQTNCQVGAELWHLEEVDARLADYFFDQHMVEVFLLDNFTVFICVFVEYVEGQAVALGEDLID